MHAKFTQSLNIIASHSDGGAEVKRVGKILRDAGFLSLIYPINNIYCTEISSRSNKTQLNFIYYIELRVSTVSGHPQVHSWTLKHIEEDITFRDPL